MSLDLETSETFIGHEMISKGSRFGVGSLIVSRVSDDLQANLWSSMPFFTCNSGSFHTQSFHLPGKNNISSSNHYAQMFHQGDETALQYYFDHYYGALLLYAVRLTDEEGFAAEMASEAFYKTWQRRGQFTTENHIISYLYKVVKNGCYHFRLKKNKLSIPASAPQYEKTAHEAIVFAETMRQLHCIITTLPHQCSTVLQSLYIEGKSVAETAEEMQLTISTIKSHKKNGLDVLRRKMKDGLISILLLLI